MNCLVTTQEIRELAKNLKGETVESVKGLVALWQKENNKSIEEYPTAKELNDFRFKLRSSTVNWARTAENGYEVSTRGDKRFSALNAAFKSGTVIDGVDVGGRTIEDVYQFVIKKSGKGQASANSSKLNLTPVRKGKMTFSYGSSKRSDVTSFTTIDAIRNGERTATTRYISDGHIDYWKSLKVGDIVEFTGKSPEDRVLVRITKPLTKLQADISPEEWSKKEGWSINYFNDKVRPKLSEAYQMEYEYIGENNKESIEDFSYTEGYLPLWQEWAKQNPELIEELREKSRGKVLTDQFANTRISQARALAQILNESLRTSEAVNMLDEALSSSFDAPKVSSIEEQAKVDLIFDPQTRRDRVSLIARFFSNEIDKATNEITESLKRRISEDSNSEDKFQLENQLANLSRFDVIKECTPKELFRRVLKIFEDYVNDTEENRVKAELDKINSTKGSEKYTDEQKLNAAQKRAEYKETAYRKIVDNYTALAEEASTLLVFSEGIRFDYDSLTPKKVNLNEEDLEGDSELDNQDDLLSKEESVKESWMVNYRLVSSHETLSQAVRKTIMQVPKLDYKGKYEKDDLGFTRYLDSNYVHAVLIDKLKDMITAEDMMPLMQELVSTKPWVKQVINLLQRDEALFSQFYQDFRKDFTPYWVQKKIMNPDGTFNMTTVSVNSSEGIYYLLDSWRDNYESGTLLDEDSVYNKNGTINIENAEKGLKWVENLNNEFSNLDTEARLKLLEEDRIWNTILKLLNMISIDANPSILKLALTDIKTIKGITFTDPIMLLLHQLNIIFSGIKRGDIKSETLEDGTEKRGDLINTFGSAYNSIADMLAEVTEDAIESSISQTIDSKTKTFYSHTNPNYLGKLIKQLKNVRGDKERFENFINSEFKSWWFYKDGKWRNDWLKQLVNSPEMRKGLSHKVVLSSDRNSYTNWDSLDYTLALLTEYWGDPENSKTNVKWAWYHIPILSDSPSAEFIKFRKYVSGVEYDEDGNRLSYEDILLDKLVDLVNQEYDRIALVIARDKQIQEGKILPIANYDVTRDKYTGKVKSLGGAEFKFLPALNSIKYEDGETFIKRLNKLKVEGSRDDLNTFIKNAIKGVMDNGFEDTYKEWTRIGLFTELPNGKYAYLPFNGQSQQNSKTVKALIRAKDILGDSWNSEMNNLLGNYNSNLPVVDNEANRVFEEIKDLIFEALKVGKVSVNEVNSINKDLVVKNRAKEALREYYWNSTFATSQIIQLTTTDLAFYKNLEDFQKRYKEVHAPSLRMNTKATYKGERIGRDWERTIYLKDDEITSSVLSDIETVLNERVKKGEMSKIDRDNIIYKFKAVNVADAQAYRSLSSYRAILGMSGQWTDEMERAFNNFKNGTWDISDFNIIWQTKKPYVYTQINNDSGVEGYDYIKTPVQHKNSEFLLLAMHELIAGPLGRSSKLKAINEFMEKHNIDVVQFESTTKVGKQGVIDINKVNTEKEVIQILEEATGISKGIENPSVVHKVSYEDYGIQTATPEHAIDAVQLVGTQIRKLITADISSDAIIKVDGKKMTKQEWLDLYNAINTENIIKSFRDIDEIFKDPKEVEKTLLDEIRGNQRYGVDMIKACTLNEDGQFNIPLFDPIQSQRVQTLLNSVIKSRITKQKIRGGALIQVSDYGLTDELHIVFEGEGDNKRIKYMECYMPAYSRDFYEPLMDPETHQLDVSKLPDDLRKLIGYRIPTEDKYSMAPLYIKGFLPQQNGSAIMLPAEITTLAGSDFDVDKLYIMLPEFKIKEVVDKKKLLTAFKNTLDYTPSRDDLLIAYDEIINGNIAFSEESLEMKLYDFYTTNKDSYTRKAIQKVKYDFDKTPQENSPEARNNLLIDMMWGILTNPDTASKILNPGGFDYQKKAARIVSILKSSYEGDLRKELNIDRGPILPKLLALDLEDLDKLAQKSKKKLNPLAPNTQVYLHQQNMTGGKLIGIYANHNANHALMQHTELGLDSENGAFILNGKKLTSLHNIMNVDKEFISKNNAGFLAASVDNVKDPVLADINQNTFTADASMLLSRLGYNPIEIGLLMAQPIIVDITQTYFKESREGKDKDTILDEILNKYKEKASMMEEITYDNYKENKFLIEDLANYILIEKEMSSLTSAHQTTDYNKVEFYKKQVAVGFLFKRIMNAANSLGQLVQATRADTANGATGPTIADTIINDGKYLTVMKEIKTDVLEKVQNGEFDNNDGTLDASAVIAYLIEQVSSRLAEFYPNGFGDMSLDELNIMYDKLVESAARQEGEEKQLEACRDAAIEYCKALSEKSTKFAEIVKDAFGDNYASAINKMYPSEINNIIEELKVEAEKLGDANELTLVDSTWSSVSNGNIVVSPGNNKTFTITPTFTDKDGASKLITSDRITYKSSNTALLNVDSNGKVTVNGTTNGTFTANVTILVDGVEVGEKTVTVKVVTSSVDWAGMTGVNVNGFIAMDGGDTTPNTVKSLAELYNGNGVLNLLAHNDMRRGLDWKGAVAEAKTAIGTFVDTIASACSASGIQYDQAALNTAKEKVIALYTAAFDHSLSNWAGKKKTRNNTFQYDGQTYSYQVAKYWSNNSTMDTAYSQGCTASNNQLGLRISEQYDDHWFQITVNTKCVMDLFSRFYQQALGL